MAVRGEYTACLIPVESDVCRIGDRLREIDCHYFIMLNQISGRFEVHHAGQTGDTLACEMPFEQLDERTVARVRETSINRADELFTELMKQDELLVNA